MRTKSNYLLLLAIAAALLLTACEPVKVSQIKADPARYRDKTVAVRGTVVTSVGVLGRGGYEVEDDTGRIYVLTNQGIPAGGSQVVVEGTIFSGATVLGQSVGVAIRETKHHVVH